MNDKYDAVYLDLCTVIDLMNESIEILEKHGKEQGLFRTNMNNLSTQIFVRIKECAQLRSKVLEEISKESA